MDASNTANASEEHGRGGAAQADATGIAFEVVRMCVLGAGGGLHRDGVWAQGAG